MIDRDSWLQDYDGYLDDQYQQQMDLEREEFEAEKHKEEYYERKYNG